MSINRSIADLLRSHSTIPTAAAAPPTFIMNGGFDVWQRGSAATSFGGFAGMPDRWQTVAGMTGSGAATIERSTDVPADEGFTYSAKIICTGINSLTSTSRVSFEQKIETQDCQEIIDQISKSGGDSVTVSFWMKFEENSSPITFPATFSCNLRDGNYSRGYCKEFTIDADATWQKITLTYPAEAQTWTNGGVNAAGITVQVMLAVGSGKTATVDAWSVIANDASGSTNNVNAFDTVGNDIFLTGFRLERGTTASDWVQEDYAENLLKCQRYYFDWTATTANEIYGTGQNDNTTQCIWSFNYPTTMRAAPTFASSAAATFDLAGKGTAINCSAVGADRLNINNCRIVHSVSSGLVAGETFNIQRDGSDTTYITWSADI